jgi:lipopolysaccharide export system permease protein
MLLIERYLLRQFAASFLAVAAVLLLVGLGGLFTDLVGEIAAGKVPPGLLLSQLGLRLLRFLPLLLPLSLFLGLLLSISRLYAESEMAVLSSVGLGPQRLWRPLAALVLPVVAVIAIVTFWLSPWSAERAQKSLDEASRSFLVAGLEPGRFVELPGRAGILYVGDLTPDGTRFRQLFVQTEREGRLDVITARHGQLTIEGQTHRYLSLSEGFRVEGAFGSRDFRMMHFARNEIRVPDRESSRKPDDLSGVSTPGLLRDPRPVAKAELHWRIGTVLFALALGLMAMPLARSQPRQPQYGLLLFAMLVYLVGMLALLSGMGLLATGKLPALFGLWWLHLPMFALACWLFWRDGRVPVPARGVA